MKTPARTALTRASAALAVATAVATGTVLPAGSASAQASQTITFPALQDTLAGTVLWLHAVSDAGLPITYSASPAATCVAGYDDRNHMDYVWATGPGTCTVTASQDGDASTAPAEPVTSTFVAKAAISFYTLGDRGVGIEQELHASSIGTSDPIEFVATPADVCDLVHHDAGDFVRALSKGTCTVTASSTPGGDYPAADDVSRSFTVSRWTQHLFMPGSLHNLAPGESQPVTATSDTDVPITFSASPAGVCAIEDAGDGTVIVRALTGAGRCAVTAEQAATVMYEPAAWTQYFDTANTLPVIQNATTRQLSGTTITVPIVATDPDGQPLTYGATSPQSGVVVLGVSGNNVTFVASRTFSGVARLTITAMDSYHGLSTAVLTDVVSPKPVAGLTARQRRTGKATVSWKLSPVAGAGYEVRVGGKVVISRTTATSVKVKHVKKGKKVTVTVLGSAGTRSAGVSVKPKRI